QVYKELPRVRKELGQVPLVTPTSQIVGTQTVNNVLFDTKEERYKMVSGQVKDLCYGLYGKTSVPIDPDVQKKALKGYARGEEPITCRPAQVLEPELEKALAEIGDLAVDEEDLLLYALFPVTGKKFLKQKYGREQVPDAIKPITLEDVKKQDALIKKAKAGELVEKPSFEKGENTRIFKVFVEGDCFEVGVEEEGGSQVITHVGPAAGIPADADQGTRASAAGASSAKTAPAPAAPEAPVDAEPGSKKASAPAPDAAQGTAVKAPMPGMVIKFEKQVGDTVDEGETVVVIEAMKMENALPAPVGGTIASIHFDTGDSVAKD
ncbi:MAG: carboxylase, partial [Desulfobacteraceae bacterium]|nr:carboxylase [Desulfobacteraceae bacterium]